VDGDRGAVLRSVGGGYLLAVAPDQLDAELFGAGVRDGRAALDAGDPARATALLREALELWGGPALAEVAFEDFAQAEIRRLEELRLVALEMRIDADLQLGGHAQLVGELEALLAEQPVRERVACQLMLALYRCERQGDALEVYQRTRAQLAEQLGLEPGPALKALQAQILDHAPALQASAMSGRVNLAPAGARVPLPPTPTIGRQCDIEDVSGMLTDPDVRLVTLTGPGGVGKTRLALETALALQASFRDGVCWVKLAGVARPDDVAATIARALAVPPLQGERTDDALRRYLADRQLLLLTGRAGINYTRITSGRSATCSTNTAASAPHAGCTRTRLTGCAAGPR